MVYIKFNNEENKTPVTQFRRLNDNIVYITGVTENTSGFKTYIDDEQVGDFSEYTTIYRVNGDVIYFSNDGSVYQTPKTTIAVHFDNDIEAPNEVKVTLNTKEEIILTSPWTKEIEYSENNFPYIESADDIPSYDKSLSDLNVYHSGLNIYYTYITEAERARREISRLKAELETYDYIGIKLAMGVATKEEYAEQIAYTETLREKIRALEGE